MTAPDWLPTPLENRNKVLQMVLSEPTITQLMAARHLYYIAKQNIEAAQTLRLFAGINLSSPTKLLQPAAH
jgi:hypothetical protein